MRRFAVAQKIIVVLLLALFTVTAYASVDTVTSATEVVPYSTEILSVKEILDIREHGTYTVGYVDDWAPLCYIDQSGNPAGVAVDAITGLMNALGAEVEFVPPGSGVQVDISLGRYGVVNGQQYTKSAPYYTSAYVRIQSNEMEQDSDKPTGTIEYFGLSDVILRQMVGDETVLRYMSYDEMNEAFHEGVIDGMILTSIRYNSEHKSLENLNYSVDVLDFHYRCGVNYAPTLDQSITESLDKMLWQVDSSESIRYSVLFHTSNVIDMEKVDLVDYAREHPAVVLVLIGAIVFCVMCYGMLIERVHAKEIEDILQVDDLTGLATRYQFTKTLEQVLKNAPEGRYVIFSFDVDNFKYINEIYGYEVGTEVLRKLSERLREEMDHTIILARSSADEFLVLMEVSALDPQLVDGMMARSVTRFTDWSEFLGEDYQFSVSVGYYVITNPKLSSNYMIDCACLARNIGKQTVGFTVHQFTEEMEQARADNNRVVATMEAAIRDREFVVYYQPKVDLQTEEITGAEALVRWRKNSTIVPPVAFIPLFEKNGFIETLDYYVLSSVCRFIKTHSDQRLPPIAVNLSAITVMQEDLVPRILAMVEHNGIAPSQIDLEITESALVDHFETAVEKIEQLRTAGFAIAMDDFGVGISSLGRLRSIPLDSIKIDRSFIVDAQKSERGTIIVQHIIRMAQDLELETVAEGIEGVDQLEFLQSLGCDVGQGYYYARPMPERDFLFLLEQAEDWL